MENDKLYGAGSETGAGLQAATLKPQVDWFTYKKGHVALDGDRVVAIIEPMEGAPCEMFGVSLMRATFTSLEAAKAYTEQMDVRMKRQEAEDEKPAPPDLSETLMVFLSEALDEMRKKREAKASAA